MTPTYLLIYEAQRVFDVGVLQGDGGSPLGEEESEDEVDDAVEAAPDQLSHENGAVTHQLAKAAARESRAGAVSLQVFMFVWEK